MTPRTSLRPRLEAIVGGSRLAAHAEVAAPAPFRSCELVEDALRLLAGMAKPMHDVAARRREDCEWMPISSPLRVDERAPELPR